MAGWRTRWAAGGSLLLALAAPAIAAEPGAVERSLGLREAWIGLTRNIPGPARWAADGRSFSYRKTVEGGFAFVSVDAASQARTVPFDAARLASGLGSAAGRPLDPMHLPFDGFDSDADRRGITVVLEGDRWHCTLDTYRCAAVVTPQPRPRGFGVVRDLRVPADDHPRLSPDGRWEALVEDDNLLVRPAGGGAARFRSRDGSPGLFYDPETIVWSPDSAHLVVHRVRPGFPRMVTRVEAAPADSLQPQLREQLYPKPGDAVDCDQPVLLDLVAGRATDIDPALFANPYEVTPAEWRADGSAALIQTVTRGFQQARVIAIDARTGRAHVAIDERAKTFVYADRRYLHAVAGPAHELIWASERDGWNHLYLIDATTGRVKTQITRGDWVVRDVVRVDDARREIVFAASGMNAGEDPYFKHYYRIGFDGRGLTPLTPARADHHLDLSPDGRLYVDTYSRVDLPDISELHRADGMLVARIETGDDSRLRAAGFRPPEPFVAKGRDGKTDIWGLIVRPRDYDPRRRYPVIENIYAGPHDSFVPKTFWPFGYHSGGDKVIGMQAQADLGFIVVQIDGMGTANRSKAFHDVAWKNVGDSGFPDRILWHRAQAARDPSYDIDRVGIYGASAGGQSALGALLFHPDFYKAAVAYAGCYDNRMDKISWNEQWMGWPVDASYAASSGVDHAAQLQGKLLLIVGEQDSNVDPASTFQVVDRLVKAGKDFELLAIPGGEHTVGRSTGPIRYVQRRQFDFFARALGGPTG